MPTYVYRCPDGHEFEAFHKMSEEGPRKCVECSKRPIERVLFPVAVHFKGSGFYATDYGRGNRKRDGSEGGAGDASEGKSAESGDSKGASETTSSGGSEGSGGKGDSKGSSGSAEGAGKKKKRSESGDG